ncbi:MAG TPA: cation transporter [Croceibacterium sp.]|nr:cation transporter [Croceibacterium sp.]
MSEGKGHPKEIRADMKAARNLEWWNIGWTITYVAALGFAMGSSQAMRTAWIEDILGLIPPIVFLISERYERRASNARFHYGYDRVNGLGFLIAAVALTAVGLLLLKDAATALIAQEHVTVGTTRIMGHDVWLGWFMLAAQAYACIPPFIIGRKELPLAERLRDKLLHTDALMNKANWQTGVAGFVGVALLGFGLWWADSVAAALISMGIIWDGWRALKVATAELVDGVPHELDGGHRAQDAKAIERALKAQFPGAKVLLRETGRYIRAEVLGAAAPKDFAVAELEIEGLECRWRLDSVAFRP